MLTQSDFLVAYRAGLLRDYPWTADTAKLDRFMESVHRTISTPARTWNHDSTTARKAWKAISGPGAYALVRLRALPQ